VHPAPAKHNLESQAVDKAAPSRDLGRRDDGHVPCTLPGKRRAMALVVAHDLGGAMALAVS
jgi:hypothetical protein